MQIDVEGLTSIAGLKALRFRGFSSVRTLRSDKCRSVPAEPGVYLFLRNPAFTCAFLQVGTGPPQHRDKQLNYAVEELEKRWIEDALVLYVGKAGGVNIASTLRSRIHEMVQYGQGVPVAHRGGRSIWQISNSEALEVCWKVTHSEEPRDLERRLISAFKSLNRGSRPYANLVD